MTTDLRTTLAMLREARQPEAVFGHLGSGPAEQLARAKKIYRHLALATHQDRHGGSDEAKQAFQLVHRWWTEAKQKIERGTYGAPSSPAASFTVTAGGSTYAAEGVFARGDLCDLYLCRLEEGSDAHADARFLLKVVRSVRNNDLAENETRVLRRLRKAAGRHPAERKLLALLPDLIDSFVIPGADGQERWASLFRLRPGFYSLEEVIRAYPEGLHAADAAWMFNRLLAALALAHTHGIIHGAVIPSHVLICPEDHGGMLIDLSYAVCWPAGLDPGGRAAAPIRAISPPYRAYYAPEILLKRPSSPATDLYMAAATMTRLLGGHPAARIFPPSIDRRLARFLRSCLIEAPARRPQDAWALYDEFQDLLTALFGRRTFRPFHMPAHPAADGAAG